MKKNGGVDKEEWSEQQDSNLRPSAPKADALPGCAMLRHISGLAPRAGLEPATNRLTVYCSTN